MHVLDASRVVDVVSGLLDPAAPRRARRREPRAPGAAARAARREAAPAAAPARRGARATASRSRSTTCRCRRSRARAIVEPALGRARPVHRLAVLLPRLGSEGQVPGDPRATRRRASSTTTRSPLLDADRRATARSRPRGVYGFWPAHAEGDDVVARRHALLLPAPAGRERRRPPEPLPRRLRRARRATRLGAFAVAIHGADELAARLRRPSTTTTARSSSRRSPTASPRRSPSGCTSGRGASGTRPTSSSPSDDLLGERFRGIRPAFGYPACPDHSEKGKLFDLLGAREIGIELTESYAMIPAAAVSGIYLAHPERAVLRGRPDRPRPARGLRGS